MKFILAIISLFLFFISFSNTVNADENFDISANTVYEVSENSPTQVTQNISILNKKEFIFTPNYSISFGFEDINNIQVYNSGGSIPFDYESEDGVVTLNINFENPPKGVNTVNNFTVSFTTDELVENKGEITEIDVPGISNPDDFTEYETEIVVPESLGEPSIIKPYREDRSDFTFSKEETKGAGIVLIFGENQYYSLDLTYNISNPNIFPIITEIALPPNTNYQTTLVENLSIEPSSVEMDQDGNWLAKYTLLPKEKKIVKARVFISLNSEPRKNSLTDEQKKLYTQSRKYWDADDPAIEELAKELKTPEKIYKYIVENLSYNYGRVSAGDERLGGKGALEEKDLAVCLEFTDLFVSVARAADIPSRAVEGYAYTRNSRLRPLSLVEDVLHAWPEYYDEEKEAWVMVDPTWGNTTNGIDYFNSLDLDHIAFAVKGSESTYPIPAGGYKFDEGSKDIDVSFIEESEFSIKNNLEIEHTFPNFSLSGIPATGIITVKNSGNSLVNNKKVVITNTTTGQVKEYTVEALLPYQEEEFKVSFDTSFVNPGDHNITIKTDELEKEALIKVSFIPDIKLLLIGGGVFAATIIVVFTAYKTWRIYIQRRKGKGNIRRKGKRS